MNKILDLIFEDVKNENETKKTAVTLRISALIFIGYFLCLMAVFCSMGDWMNVGGCLVCGVCYVLSFYTTYWNHTRESAWISQILMIVWIILFIVMFGWDCGVQHYLFAFLALNFTVSTAGERRKVLNAVGACALRLALYAYARNFEPYSPLDPGISVLIQILNTIFIFAQITAIMIIFTKDAQKMEQKLVRYNTKLQKIASVDALTGLWNRRSMWEYIRAVEYDYEIGNAGFVSIAIADIDFFKRINDTYGHDAGDEVLKAVAELFMDKMKTYGRVCRWGGEEFLFVFYGRNGDAAYDVLQEIYDEIHRLTVSYENEEIRITMTFGLEEYDKNDGMEMAIRRADEKLYQEKRPDAIRSFIEAGGVSEKNMHIMQKILWNFLEK